MHKSRLAGFIIDCRTEDLEGAARFWSQALGCPLKPAQQQTDEGYVMLEEGPDGLHVEVQRVDHESRVHLDIETNDIEAEVQRLERLGARRLDDIKGWVVMEAPSGQRFCVVKPTRKGFDIEANEWR